jgi:hypothetical protein
MKYSRADSAESGAERGIAEAAETSESRNDSQLNKNSGNWFPRRMQTISTHHHNRVLLNAFGVPDDSAFALHDMAAGGEEDVFTFEHVNRDTLSSEAETVEGLDDEDTYSASESDEDGS